MEVLGREQRCQLTRGRKLGKSWYFAFRRRKIRLWCSTCGSEWGRAALCVCPKALCVRVFHAALGRKAIRNRFAAAFVSECEKLRVQLYPAPPATRSPDLVALFEGSSGCVHVCERASGGLWQTAFLHATSPPPTPSPTTPCFDILILSDAAEAFGIRDQLRGGRPIKTSASRGSWSWITAPTRAEPRADRATNPQTPHFHAKAGH